MAYKRTWKLLQDLPARCPVCDDRRSDKAAIATHNVLASALGCRAYPVRRP